MGWQGGGKKGTQPYPAIGATSLSSMIFVRSPATDRACAPLAAGSSLASSRNHHAAAINASVVRVSRVPPIGSSGGLVPNFGVFILLMPHSQSRVKFNLDSESKSSYDAHMALKRLSVPLTTAELRAIKESAAELSASAEVRRRLGLPELQDRRAFNGAATKQKRSRNDNASGGSGKQKRKEARNG